MGYSAEQASKIAALLAGTVKFEHLRSKRFDRQTDAVQLSFATAQMEAQRGCATILVDGLIKTELQTAAVNHKRGPQAFFAQRCNDKKLNCRRVIFLDASNTRTMSSKATGEGIMHFHGMFLLEHEQSEAWLRKKLTEVFGHAGNARRYQFKFGRADGTRAHSYADQNCRGITGKLAYMLSHVGTTCRRLKLNNAGKRSRKAPRGRARVNIHAQGLARGVPSNFVSKVLIWDTKTRKIAKAAFEAWYERRLESSSLPEANAETATDEQQVLQAG